MTVAHIAPPQRVIGRSCARRAHAGKPVRDEAEDDHERDDAQRVGRRDDVKFLEDAQEAEEAERFEHAEHASGEGLFCEDVGRTERPDWKIEREEPEHVDGQPAGARIVADDLPAVKDHLIVRIIVGCAHIEHDVNEEETINENIDGGVCEPLGVQSVLDDAIEEEELLSTNGRRLGGSSGLEGVAAKRGRRAAHNGNVNAVVEDQRYHEEVPILLESRRRRQDAMVFPQVAGNHSIHIGVVYVRIRFWTVSAELLQACPWLSCHCGRAAQHGHFCSSTEA